MASIEVLDPAQASPSASFRLPGGGNYQIVFKVHTGGTWKLECKHATDDPAIGPWVDTLESWNDVGVKRFGASPDLDYRLSGGVTGAHAYATSESPRGSSPDALYTP